MQTVRPTIADVAERAGVSKTTVSFAINEPDRVGAGTLATVRGAMAELGYKPRRNSRRRREVDFSHVTLQSLALLFPDPDARAMRTPLSAALAHGIEGVCHDHGAAMYVTHLRDEQTLPAALTRAAVDGVIIRAGTMVPALEQLASVPTVWAFELPTMPAWGDVVMPDDDRVGQLAANYLLKRGHRHIAILSTTHGGERHPAFRLRASACREACLADGVRADDLEFDGETAAAETVLARCAAHGADAIYVAGHESLTELLNRAQLTGECRYDMVGQTYDPSRLQFAGVRLAAIDIRPDLVGRMATEQLIWRLQNPRASQRRILVPPRLLAAD